MDWFVSWAKEKSLSKTENVWISNPPPEQNFTEQYLELRRKEKRIATDDELSNLPLTNSSHPHHREWELRNRSLNKFLSWLNTSQKKQSILEIGCGNGWFSANLRKQGHKVIAQDVNLQELKQAAFVFADSDINFLCAEIMNTDFPEEIFDQIVFASSLQYFKDINTVFRKLNKSLKPGGRIHIIDSPLYSTEQEASDAKQRSQNYYNEAGFGKLSNHYHHHLLSDFKNFTVTFHQKHGGNFFGKMLNLQSPFYWISVAKY